MYKLSSRSLKNIEKISPYLQKIVVEAIKLSNVDFGIIHNGGYRTAEMQKSIFDRGRSKCDGTVKKSYHQSGNAVDLVPYVKGSYTWADKQAFIDVYRAFVKAEIALKEKGLVPNDVYFHHGIFWRFKDLNGNGKLDINDKQGWDSAHIEQRSKPQPLKVKDLAS